MHSTAHMSQRAQRWGGARLPDAEVEVIRAGDDVGGVTGEARGKHALHALCRVHLAAVAAVVRVDAYAAVVRPRHKLAARW